MSTQRQFDENGAVFGSCVPSGRILWKLLRDKVKTPVRRAKLAGRERAFLLQSGRSRAGKNLDSRLHGNDGAGK